MINDKIGKLISELDTAADIMVLASLIDKNVYEARIKIMEASLELKELANDIEAEKAIDGCRVRQLEMCDDGAGDCGTDENGRCLGYSNEYGTHEECRTCEYSVHYGEEEV